MTFALYLATGIPFFVGVACCALAPAADRFGGRRRWLAIPLLAAGVLGVAISATPVAWPIVVAELAAAVGWLVARRRTSRAGRRSAAGCAVLLVFVAIGAAGIEIPHSVTPRLPDGEARRLVVLGDSLSAGIGDGVETWPGRLAQEHAIEVRNLASPGATTQGARVQAEAIPADADVVAVLIGGNDYLQGRTAGDFERDLDAVVSTAAARGRRVVMFELPVLPGGNGYVAAQRRVAGRHGFLLIPRWRLAMALAGGGATSDGLHLSAVGQAAVARIVWEVIGPGFAKATGTTPKSQATQSVSGDGAASRVAEADGRALGPAEVDGESGGIEETGEGPDMSGGAPAVPLRIATWNVQKCVGGVEAIVERLRAIDADVVCLQELVGPAEGGGIEDQTRRIADELSMYAFSDCGRLDDERMQCIAILSKTPLRDGELLRTAEDRAYGVSAVVERPGGVVRVVSVHLAGTWRLEPAHVAETTARREVECPGLAAWVAQRWDAGRGDEALVIAGDFNPVSGECIERLGRVLARVEGIGATFPSSLPVLELDRVFCSSMLRVRSVRCDDSVVADHRAVVVELERAAETE
ncbi:MAG: hypothetical protein IT450_14535 [Phycisphaerales bacterium]|nr:hypothetical protein [Phycisphaerales bacterium]